VGKERGRGENLIKEGKSLEGRNNTTQPSDEVVSSHAMGEVG